MATVIAVDGTITELDLAKGNPAGAMRQIEKAVGGIPDRLAGEELVFVRRRWSELRVNPTASTRLERTVGGTVVILDAAESVNVPPRPLTKRQQVREEIKRLRPMETRSFPDYYLFTALAERRAIARAATEFDPAPPFAAEDVERATKIEIWATYFTTPGPDHSILKLFLPDGSIREARIEGY